MVIKKVVYLVWKWYVAELCSFWSINKLFLMKMFAQFNLYMTLMKTFRLSKSKYFFGSVPRSTVCINLFSFCFPKIIFPTHWACRSQIFQLNFICFPLAFEDDPYAQQAKQSSVAINAIYVNYLFHQPWLQLYAFWYHFDIPQINPSTRLTLLQT